MSDRLMGSVEEGVRWLGVSWEGPLKEMQEFGIWLIKNTNFETLISTYKNSKTRVCRNRWTCPWGTFCEPQPMTGGGTLTLSSSRGKWQALAVQPHGSAPGFLSPTWPYSGREESPGLRALPQLRPGFLQAPPVRNEPGPDSRARDPTRQHCGVP